MSTRTGYGEGKYAPPQSQKQIVALGNGSLDAFHRLPVSNPIQLINSRFDHHTASMDLDKDRLWNFSATGAGAYALQANKSSLLLSVSGIGDKVVAQTKGYFSYRAGNPLKGFLTFTLGTPVTGVRQRIGYFDDADGLYFEKSEGDVFRLVIRSSASGSVVEDVVPRSAWEHFDGFNWVHDGLDGNGPSGVTGDPEASQIFAFDLQWLGVGLVRTGFDIDGQLIPAHYFRHANIDAGVYMRSACLPLRYEIEAVGDAAGSLEMICSTLLREGSEKEPSRSTSVDRGASTINVSSSNVRQAVLGLRLHPDHTKSLLEDFVPTVIATDRTSSDEYFWELIIDPEIGASYQTTWDAGWANAPSTAYHGVSQRNVPTALVLCTANTGYVVASGYMSSSSSGGSVLRQVGEALHLGQKNIAGDPQELVLCVQPITGSGLPVSGSIGYKEIL